jgi:hypothetical protein
VNVMGDGPEATWVSDVSQSETHAMHVSILPSVAIAMRFLGVVNSVTLSKSQTEDT